MNSEIVTARLRLRRSRPDDLEAMHRLASDWEVVKQTATWPWPPDRGFTATRAQPMPPETGLAGPVFAGGEMVGMMGVNAAGAGAELGYMFARAHWGKGYATEMGRALVAHAVNAHDWPVIEACVFLDNPASARVLEKLGFTEGPACAGMSAARGGRFPTLTFVRARTRGEAFFARKTHRKSGDFRSEIRPDFARPLSLHPFPTIAFANERRRSHEVPRSCEGLYPLRFRRERLHQLPP